VNKRVTLHPFLFAILPILFLYAHNISELSLPELLMPLAVAGLSSLVLWSLLSLILRDKVRAALLSSLFWLWFFAGGHLYRLVAPPRAADSATSWASDFLIVYCALLLAGAALLIAQRRRGPGLSSALNIIAVVVFAWNALVVSSYEIQRLLAHRRIRQAEAFDPMHTARVRVRPNIYYIILDGYGRADVLRDIYHYDNREFLQYLTRKGFHVVRNARANYCQTLSSLASSLNLHYLDDLARRLGAASTDRDPLRKTLERNRLFEFLRRHGYRIVAFASGYSGTEIRAADIYINKVSGLTEFQSAIFDATPLSLIFPARPPERGLTSTFTGTILYTFEHLADTTKLKPPIFVFAHILCPHPPFVFDRNGRVVMDRKRFTLCDGQDFPGTRAQYVAGYKEQLLFVNHKTVAAIDEILARARWPTVIILQSDHGPGSRLNWGSAERTDLRERLAMLMACYLPGAGDLRLEDDLSSVNVFRVVLNSYFGTRLRMLPNKSYYSPIKHPYWFVRVTDDVLAGARKRGPLRARPANTSP